jgi:Helicase conserved C-terminal domain
MPPPSVSSAGPGGDAWVMAVAGADDEWLVGLLQRRPDLVLAAPAHLYDLGDLTAIVQSVGAYYDMADRATRQVLEALCVLPSPTDLDSLALALPGEPAIVARLVDELVAAGMLLPGAAEPGRWVRNPGLIGAIRHPAGLAGPLAVVLGSTSARDLTDMAARVGVLAKGAKAMVLETLAFALSAPERVTAAVEAGPEGTAELAGRLASGAHEVGLPWGTYETARSDRTPEGWLLRRALLAPTGWGTAVMPSEVAVALRGGRLFDSFLPDGPALPGSPVEVAQVDRAAAEVALQLVTDVTVVLEAWAAEPAKLLRAGGLGAREVKRVAKLTGRDEAVAARLVDLAVAAGLADADGDLALPTSAYDRWSSQLTAQRWLELAEAWTRSPLHLSLAGAVGTNDKPIPPLLDRLPELEVLPRRQAVLSYLAGLAPGIAVERSGAAARLAWIQPALWLGGPALPSTLIGWGFEEPDLLGLTALGALSSAGRCLVVGDREGVLAALGAFSPPVTSEVVLQADLTAVASGELASDLRRELDLLADVESAGAATVYRFSETSLRRGFDAGRSAEELLAWLGERAPKGIPQPLRYLIEDLARRFGRARVGPASSYVRSDDPALLVEAVRARKTARLNLRLLAPTVAVSDAEPDVVVRTLRDAGYLAAPEEVDGTLKLTTPPAQRSSAEDDSPYEDPELYEFVDQPEALAAFVGLPASAVPPALMAVLRQALDGGDGDADPGGDLAQSFDPGAVVGRLRRAGLGPSAGGPRPTPAPPPSVTRDPFPQLDMDDGGERPTVIAKDTAEIVALLDLAMTEGWTVRLSYPDSRGRDIETYGAVLGLSRQGLYLESYPSGQQRKIKPELIQWARVATEAEEERMLP